MKKHLKEYTSIGNTIILTDWDLVNISDLVPGIDGSFSLERHLKGLGLKVKMRKNGDKTVLAFADGAGRDEFIDLLDAWGFNESRRARTPKRNLKERTFREVGIYAADRHKVARILKDMGVDVEWGNGSKPASYVMMIDGDDYEEVIDELSSERIRYWKESIDTGDASLAEAAQKLIKRLVERNKELSAALTEAQKRISILEEINETMDDLSRLSELKRVRQVLVQKYPALEGADHLLSKATTIEELKKSARDILLVLREKEKKQQEVKQPEIKKEVAENKQSATVNNVSETSVSSETEVLTENFGDPLSRLADRYRASKANQK